MSVYDLPPDLPSDVWHGLVRALFAGEQWFGLVWRSGHGASRSKAALGIRTLLDPLVIDVTRTDRWPGTRLIDHQATVVRYHATSKALELFLAVDDLVDWRSPDRPEDPFFGSGDDIAFFSTTHDRRAWLVGRRYARTIAQQVRLRKERLDPELLGLSFLR